MLSASVSEMSGYYVSFLCNELLYLRAQDASKIIDVWQAVHSVPHVDHAPVPPSSRCEVRLGVTAACHVVCISVWCVAATLCECEWCGGGVACFSCGWLEGAAAWPGLPLGSNQTHSSGEDTRWHQTYHTNQRARARADCRRESTRDSTRPDWIPTVASLPSSLALARTVVRSSPSSRDGVTSFSHGCDGPDRRDAGRVGPLVDRCVGPDRERG